MAHIAGHVHIGQEMHLALAHTVPLARLAPSALYIEGETPRQVAARLGVRRFGKQVTDIVEQGGIGRRV